MAIFLREEWASKVAETWTRRSLFADKASSDYNFDGVKDILISSIRTQSLNDYDRNGGMSRYGTPKEVQDAAQRLTMRTDKSFSMTIDKGNNTEQDMIKNAGKVVRRELEEQVIPYFDQLVGHAWATGAGKIVGVANALTKSTFIGEINKAKSHFVNNHIPFNNVYLYIPTSMMSILVTCPEFLNLEKLGTKVLVNGMVGKLSNFPIIEVADQDLPEGVQFMIAKKECLLFPKKIWDTNIHQNPPGISGHLMEGRFIGDGFVIGEKALGVYTCVLASKMATAPTIAAATGTITTNNFTVKYTDDDSDPRYSASAKIYTAPLGDVTKKTIKFYAYKERDDKYYDGFPSDVVVSKAAA